VLQYIIQLGNRKNIMSFSKFKHLATDDFQKRDGNFSPRNGIPDSIDVYDDYIRLTFKNTSERSARDFAERFAARNKIQFKNIDSCQDGDYEDDWVTSFLYPVDVKDEVAYCPECGESAGLAFLNDNEINCNKCGAEFISPLHK